MTYLALSLVCIVGAILQSSIGFGFPIFAMIFTSMLFPFQTAVTITQTVGILGVAYFFFRYISQVRWRVLLPFLLSALPIGMFFTSISVGFDVTYLKIMLGFVLIFIALFFLFFSEKTSIKPTKTSGAILGGMSGVLNGVFAIGGPPVALYLLPAINDKIPYIATANAYFFIFKVFNLAIRFRNGSFSYEIIPFLIIGIISMTAGSLIGDKIMHLLPLALLKKLVYLFVGISGVVIILQGIG